MMISNFLNIANIIFEFPGQIMFTSIEKREIQKRSNLSTGHSCQCRTNSVAIFKLPSHNTFLYQRICIIPIFFS